VKSSKKNFCAAPWAGLSLNPNGEGGVCCISLDHAPIQDFKEIKSNPVFMNIRTAFINDEQHPNCRQCWDREAAGDPYTRRSTYQYEDYFHDLDSTESFKLEHLDLRWSNTCNLNCVYCSPYFSSRWADLKGLTQKFRVFPTITDSDLVTLKFLQLAGGEPLLIKENYDLLERLLKINPEIKVEVTTNLTSISNNKIYQILKNFSNVTFVVSFESTGKKFEYIRNGAQWNEFKSNLQQLNMDFLDVQVNMVYFPLSATDIDNAITVALDHTNPDNIFIVSQFGGHGFDCVSKNALQLINQKNINLSKQLPTILEQRLFNQVQLATTQQEITHLPKYEEFDLLTNQDHRKIFAELYE
jgi:MoaA/NifB/PqqE/SkfB family radical SAM enzyme